MHDTLDALGPVELRVLAQLRIDVTAHLVAEAAAVDKAVASGARRPFVLKLACPGCAPAYVVCRRAGAGTGSGLTFSASSGRGTPAPGRPSLTLRFGSPAACARALAGGGGTPIPVPGGPGMLAALAWFRAAAARAGALLSDQSVPAEARARLLAVAALQGVAAVGSSDPSLAERLHHVPDGTVAVEASGSFSLGVIKTHARIQATPVAATSPSARLSFADASTALAVLSGRRSAVVALGSGEVTLRGLLPLVQGMFGILDRVAEYLGVKVGVKEKTEAAQ